MVRSQAIFYILFVYILAFFIWWSYYLLSLNKKIYERDIVLIELTESPEFPSDTKTFVTQEYDKAVRMIVSEGAVFLLLLVLGFWKVRQSFLKERFVSRQQHNFLLSVTHELKSPLAAVKLSLQTIQKRELEKEQQEKLIVNSIDDVKRVETLVDNMLLATRMENKGYTYTKDFFDLSELLNIQAAKIQSIHADKRNLYLDIDENIKIIGDRIAISSALSNILENAVKYSAFNDNINISLKVKGNKICIRIADTGIGIPSDERKNIFKRFYRVGNEDTRNTNGTGLGLFIANQVIKDHNGKILVKNNAPKGTVFDIMLPYEQ